MVTPSPAWLPTLALVLVLSGGCRRPAAPPPDRAATLRSLVEQVVLPSYGAVSGHAQRLGLAVRALAEAPAAPALAQAQQAWRELAVACKRTYAFRSGPIESLSFHFKAAYWPVRPASIEAAFADGAPLDASTVGKAGAAVRGLFAVEHLLFDPRGDEAVLAALAGSERRRLFLRLLVEDLERLALQLETAALSGGLAQAFAAGGQQSLNRLVNDLTETVEAVVAGKLDLARQLHEQGGLGRGRFEGERSAVSRELAAALLAGAAELYLGKGESGGVSTLVAAVAPAVDGRTREALAAAGAALAKLPGPIERVAASDPAALARARAACHTAERLLKADVMSALGVTITFRSVDGD